MEKKYKFETPSSEEHTNFTNDLNALLEKYSFAMSVVPQFLPNEATKAFEITSALVVQKKVAVAEEPAVVSPLSEELKSDESPKEA